MQGRCSITLQLVERGKAAGQGEDQRLDGAGDIQTVAGRPIRVDRHGVNAPEQFRAGEEAVSPEIPGDGDHSPIENMARSLKWSADVHLVDNYVLEHGQRRQARQMRANENDASKVLEKLGDGNRASLSGILIDISVDTESRCHEPPGSLSNGHAGL